MNKLIFTMVLSFFMGSCLTPKKTTTNNSQSLPSTCNECNNYLLNILKPQMSSCGAFNPDENFRIKTHDECKFDREQIKKFHSCLFGMKKEQIEKIIGVGPNYSYFCECMPNTMSNYLKLSYSNKNNRLIEINDAYNVYNMPCFECDFIYQKMRDGLSIDEIDFKTFENKYQSCLYGKFDSMLSSFINLENKINEDDYHNSYNKSIIIKNEVYNLNFLFSPSNTLVEIRSQK